MANEAKGTLRTLEALTSALQSLPHAHAHTPEIKQQISVSTRKIDATVDFEIAEKKLTLLVEIKKSVFPRDIRQLLWQLHEFRNAYVKERQIPVIAFVAAESISEGARKLLQAEDIGYFDTGGSLFIPATEHYIFIERPVPKTLKKSFRSLFTGKRSQVLHALLMKREEWLGVTKLSQIAKVSPATASETLTGLEKLEWLDARGQGPSKERRLSHPGAALDEWKAQIQASGMQLARRRYYVSGGDLAALARRVAKECDDASIEYALTQEVAAQRYAPLLSSTSRLAFRVHPGSGAEQVLKVLDARPVTEGANLDILEAKTDSELLFREKVDGIWLTSPIQLYLDLLRGEGRARDLAEHLRKELLRI